MGPVIFELKWGTDSENCAATRWNLTIVVYSACWRSKMDWNITILISAR